MYSELRGNSWSISRFVHKEKLSKIPNAGIKVMANPGPESQEGRGCVGDWLQQRSPEAFSGIQRSPHRIMSVLDRYTRQCFLLIKPFNIFLLENFLC